MTLIPACRATLLAVLASGTALVAQEPGERLCGTCKTTGKVALEIESKYVVESDQGEAWNVLFCSEAIAADDMALDWKPCPRCKTPSVQAAAQAQWDEIRARNEAWLGERRRVDRVIGADDEVLHLETTHVLIAWNIDRIKADGRSLRAHDAAHLYARRMEELYAKYQRLLDVNDADNMRNTHHILAFETSREALAAGPVFAGISGTGTVKRAGGVDQDSVVVTWRNKSEHPKDEDMHRHWIHNMVHQVTAVYYNPYWFPPHEIGLLPPWLNDKYGWLDAGLAHWFEMDFDGQASTFCFREQDNSQRWKGSDWRKNVWKAVMAEDTPPFAEVITKPTQSLSAMEHQIVWSWVDYLMHTDSKAMGVAIKLAKMETPVRDMLKQAWDMSMLSFEERWAEWVKQAYAPSNKEGPILQPQWPVPQPTRR